jgi:hypothetical protein
MGEMLAMPARVTDTGRRTLLHSLSAPSSGSATVFVIALLRAPFLEADRPRSPPLVGSWSTHAEGAVR